MIDKVTEDREELKYARLNICLPIETEAKVNKKVKINGKVYQVSIEEETPLNESLKCSYGFYSW